MRLQKRDNGLRNGTLAGHVEFVVLPKPFERLIQIISELFLAIASNCSLILSGPSQKHGGRHRLRALNTLGVIMRHSGAGFGFFKNLFQRVERPANWADTHRGSIAIAVVCLIT